MIEHKINIKMLTDMGLIAKRNCKVCEHEYEAFTLDRRTLTEVAINGYYCDKCKNYSAKFNDGLLESETITSGNYHLVFFPEHKEATVVERNMDEGSSIRDFRKVKTFPLNELTHELAVQWVNKLKTYVIFQ